MHDKFFDLAAAYPETVKFVPEIAKRRYAFGF
jgi:hypothetical protein